jgi:hypothetical protein
MARPGVICCFCKKQIEDNTPGDENDEFFADDCHLSVWHDGALRPLHFGCQIPFEKARGSTSYASVAEPESGASKRSGDGAMERKPLLTSEELNKLEALAGAMRQIARHNFKTSSTDKTMADDIDHLHTLVKEDRDRDAIAALAEELNAETLMDWAEALDEGQRTIDKLTLKLSDGHALYRRR